MALAVIIPSWLSPDRSRADAAIRPSRHNPPTSFKERRSENRRGRRPTQVPITTRSLVFVV